MKPVKTTVYGMNVRALQDGDLFEKACRAVPWDRRQKAEKYPSAKDRALSVGAALLLRYALILNGTRISDLAWEISESGKPYFKDYPELQFNLSHSEEYVLCALSDCEVGCDVEKVTEIDLKIARRFFAPEEYAAIKAQPTESAKTEMFFRYWTLKESFVKAVGTGMKLPLNSFRIERTKNGISVLCHPDSDQFRFSEFETVPGYRCAVCVKGSGEKVDFSEVDPHEILT